MAIFLRNTFQDFKRKEATLLVLNNYTENLFGFFLIIWENL